MIDMSKQYRTRDGREVRIYATDGIGEYPIHGAIKGKSGWGPVSWTVSGICGIPFGFDGDIIEVKPRHKRTVWLNVNPDDGWFASYPSKEHADRHANTKRIACIKVDLDFEEGEGL